MKKLQAPEAGVKMRGDSNHLIDKSVVMKLAAALACALMVPCALAGTVRWKVEFAAGDAAYRQSDGGQWKKCAPGAVLDGSGMVRTGKKSTLVLETGTRRVTVGPESTVSLDALLAAKDSGPLLDLSNAASRAVFGILHEKRGRMTETLGVRGDDAGNDRQPVWSDDLEPGQPGDQALEIARKNYDEGKYEEVIAALKDAGGMQSDEQACLAGMSYFNLGYYRESIDSLDRAASSKALGNELKTTCRFLAALSRIYLGDHQSSIADLESLAEARPASDLAPRACFVLAGLYRVRGDADAARRWYEALISRYPSSDLVPEARRKLAEMQ